MMHFLAAASQQVSPGGGGGACWEGVMTVGEFKDNIGYDKDDYGSITNSPALNCQSQQVDNISLESSVYLRVGISTVGEIEIDGVVYNMNNNNVINLGFNPFPPVGETCLIRILS